MLTEKLYEDLDILSRHIKVLELVKEKQPIGIVRMSQILEIGEHEVRHSLSVLEDEGLIKPTPNGAVIRGNIRDNILKIAEVLDEIGNTSQLLKKEILKMIV